MSAKEIRAQLAILEWVVRLTLTGMTVGMLRYRILKKHEELEIELERQGRGGDKSSTAS